VHAAAKANPGATQRGTGFVWFADCVVCAVRRPIHHRPIQRATRSDRIYAIEP
jgi:hypothetical protein